MVMSPTGTGSPTFAGRPNRRPAQARAARRLRAFTILEATIAVAILGIGLIMIASIFPVAMSQHRDNAERAHAQELASKAEALLKARIDPATLWTRPPPPDTDPNWYVLPSFNLEAGTIDWDEMPVAVPPTYAQLSQYANVINGVTDNDLPASNVTVLTAMDILSDRLAPFSAGDWRSPFNDNEFGNVASRMMWTGFYRKQATATFCVAVCAVRRGQYFAQQDLGPQNVTWAQLDPAARTPFSGPIANVAGLRRLPAVWRVSVGYARLPGPVVGGDPRNQQIGNTPVANDPRMFGGGVPLGVLAPRGSKLMIQGAVNRGGVTGTTPTVPAGRMLTVSDVLYGATGLPTVVEVLEDITDLPPFEFEAGARVTFDVWVFPPAVLLSGNPTFGRSSPVVEWRFQ